MKRILVLFVFLLLAYHLPAQESCSEEMIMAVKGKWVKHADATMQTGNQAAITTRLDKMQQLLQAAYPEPKGIEAYWYRSMGGYYAAIAGTSTAYELNALFKTYYCNTHLKKMLLATESGTTFDLWSNKFKWFAEIDDKFLVNNKPVYLLTKELGELNGFPLYAGINNATSNTGTSFSKTILISRPGMLPYLPVSRKQYLLVFLSMKDAWQKSYKENLLKMPVRSDTEEEAFKNQQMEKAVIAAGTDEKLRERARNNFLRGYTTAKQRQQADIARSEEIYRKDTQAAAAYLANTPAEELEKPAYLKSGYIGYFREFAKPSEGMMMVQVNENYFNKTLPAHVPQFIIAYWRWNTEKPSLDYAGHIESNFNFKALQEMLDK